MITWIASYPKSGSTWLRGFLSAYLNHGDLDINKMRFVDTDDLSGYFHQIVSPFPPSRMEPVEILQIRGAALLHISKLLDYPLVKTHSIYGELSGVDLIPQCLTDRAIYILRDPRDIVLSLSHQLEWEIDECIDFINNPHQKIFKEPTFMGLFNFVGLWSQHVMTWGEQRMFRTGLARYEDLYHKPEKSFKKILNFLDWGFEEELFQKSLDVSSFQNMKRQEKEALFRENKGNVPFFNKGIPGRWKDELTEKQVLKIEEQHFDVMLKMNYELAALKDVA